MTTRKKRLRKGVKVFFSLIILLGIVISLIYLIPRLKNEANLIGFYFEDVTPTQEVGKLQTLHEYDSDNYISHVINYPLIGKDEIDTIINNIVKGFVKDFNNDYKDKINSKNKYYQYIEYESYLAPDGLMSIIFIESREINEDEIDTIKIHPYVFDLNNCEIAKDSNIFIGNYKNVIKDYLKEFLPSSDEYKNVLIDNYEDKLIDNFEYAINNNGIIVYYDQEEITNDTFEDYVDVTIPFDKFSGYLNIDSSLITKKLKYGSKKDTNNETFETYNKKLYAKQMLNMYASSSRNSDLITTLNKGTKVSSISKSNTGWTRVNYDGKEGYISSSLLSEEVIVVEGMKSVDETVYAISEVNVREKESIESTKLGSLNRKDSVKRVGVSDSGWSEVIYNGESAYIVSSFLSTTEPVDEAKQIDVNVERPIESSSKMVALTFDDGPNPKQTGRILDTLEKYNVVATFFDVGNLVNSYPSTVQREEALGCEVGSHSYSHPNLNTLSVAQIQEQVDKTNAAFTKALGHTPTIMRAPYGNSNKTVRDTINMPFIYWSIDTLDWKTRNKDSILSEINKYKNLDGKIILMHGIYSSTADAVEELVPKLISEGYQLVTVSELAKYKGKTLENGKIYYNFN